MTKPRAIVLVVDDEVDLVDIFKTEFEDRGCKVFAAHNGIDALKIAQTEHLDVVITDICMPGMNGMELLKALESNPSGRRPFVVTMSGYSTYTPNELDKEGSAGFLTKPIQYKQIVELIEHYVMLIADQNAA